MAVHPKATHSYQLATLSFIHTELETAETFADIALLSEDAAKTERNRKNARIGYDTALRFLATLSAGRDENRHLQQKLANVRSKLRVLGETF